MGNVTAANAILAGIDVAGAVTANEFGAAVKYVINLQSEYGRAQYAVSFEGEELGSDKTLITGRKAMMPFDINISGTKVDSQPSYMLTFVRADFVLYVRPDLIVTVLGK
jgi:hypothetical protein